MSDVDNIARRHVLAVIGATAFAAFFNPALVRAQALTIADVYVPFTDVGGAVLEKVAAAKGVKITPDDCEELTGRFATIPPYPDVPGALQRLKAAGFLLFTLTDNTAPISGRQLTYAGLIDLFDRRFSVDDTAKRHKPAPEAYAEVTRALGAAPSEMCMVACHTWDTIGAKAAGWEAGLIKRSTTMSWIPRPNLSTWERTSTTSPTRLLQNMLLGMDRGTDTQIPLSPLGTRAATSDRNTA